MKWASLKHHACSTFLFATLIAASAFLATVEGASTEPRSTNVTKPKVRRNKIRNSKNVTSPGTSKEEQLAEVNETVFIACSPNKTVVHGCEWYKTNPQVGIRKRITQFFDRYQKITPCELQIRSVTYEDAGMFTCEGFNEATEPTVHISQLTVTGEDDPFGNRLKPPSSKEAFAYSEPEIAQDSFSIDKVYKVHKGGNLLVHCRASGNSKPIVSWRRGSKMYTTPAEGYSTLKLTNLTNDDSGIYKCEAVNLFGKCVQEITLQVRGATQGSAEILEVTPRNVTLYEGSQLNVTCIAKFEGDPWFGWVKKIENKTANMKTFRYEGHDYAVLQRTEIRQLGQQLYATTLLLQNVTIYHTGVYHCIVAGLQGYNHTEAYVVVEKDPSKLHKDHMRRHKTVAIFAIFLFIIFVTFVIFCILRVYGCPNAASRKLSSQGSLQSASTSTRKTQLPKRSPETLSTDCAHPRHESFHPLVTHGSCSLGSRDPSVVFRNCTSSCDTYNCNDPEFSISGEESSIMADLEAARSSHSRAESYCDIEFCTNQSPNSLRTQTSEYYPRHQSGGNRNNGYRYNSYRKARQPQVHRQASYHPVKPYSEGRSKSQYSEDDSPCSSCSNQPEYSICHSYEPSNLSTLSADYETRWNSQSNVNHYNYRRKLNPSPNFSVLDHL